MNKCYPTLLATMVWAALYSQQAHADLAAQCMLGVPVYDKPIITGDPNKLPIHIQSDDTHGEYPSAVEFVGNVDIQQGNKTLTADRVRFEQTEDSVPVRTMTATGNVRYDDPQIILKGPRAWSNLTTKDTDVEQGKYQMVGRQGRGNADKMMLRNENRYTILNNGVFTSCLPGNDSWSVAGSEVILDRQEEVAEIWNARFRVANVPVFYTPYLQLPIGDKRRSGFLIPNASFSNKNGIQILLPYYWNIAPNYDATITPHLISKRGLKFNNEFRYLTKAGSGTVALDWIGNDRLYTDDKKFNLRPERDSNNRWLFYWNHSGVMNQVWRFNAEYTKVSDPHYFTDFNSQYGTSTDGYATQKFSIGYAQRNWNATLTTKQFQIFTVSDSIKAYRATPQLDLNYYKNDLGPFDFRTYAQFAKFTSVGKEQPNAIRWHLEPSINLPLSNGWASLNNEIKLMATYYQQDIPAAQKNSQLEKSANRVLPQFKSDAKMVFERAMYFNPAYTQTLEPRIQYLYVPYKNQNNIYNYDSSLLQANYTGLFRDRFYSGLDRISSANQFTSGITTRIYDEDLVERFSLSVGQIYYFEAPRVKDIEPTQTGQSTVGTKKRTGSTTWAGDVEWKISSSWGFKGGVQYDTRLSKVAIGNSVVEYRRDADRLIQLNYRFVDRDYIQATLRSAPAYQQGISQVGMVGSWPLGDRWALVGAYYYDTKKKQPASKMVGMQYSTCCWAVNVGYERKIVNWKNNQSEYDNKWSLNVELRGLSNNYSLGSLKMLQQGILPYQRAF
ncbi:LPS assembly protein LptD [Xenorhabdus budapestensis]|uniref:LPS-assembly protein LptD n=1 Tax=Xenorhabdus budapestensis TaxID=290110 RepID=A0A2D0J3M4_XENBU|nr:LPS assembly protein LptD [Xenorhabdus budapestensis]PHM28982.1 LPS assembly protein LptD [Xenorhabdus budapestensis]QTL39470.1 LPS assembly protein LptD [Xenorhabdus budapestensis]